MVIFQSWSVILLWLNVFIHVVSGTKTTVTKSRTTLAFPPDHDEQQQKNHHQYLRHSTNSQQPYRLRRDHTLMMTMAEEEEEFGRRQNMKPHSVSTTKLLPSLFSDEIIGVSGSVTSSTSTRPIERRRSRRNQRQVHSLFSSDTSHSRRQTTAIEDRKSAEDLLDEILIENRMLEMSTSMSMSMPASSSSTSIDGRTDDSSTSSVVEGRVEQPTRVEVTTPNTITTPVPEEEKVAIDTSTVVLSYQAIPGTCSGSHHGVGCARLVEESNTTSASHREIGGNPNSLLNCFDISPFVDGNTTKTQLSEIRFWVGESTDLPADVSIQVWDTINGTIESGPHTIVFEQDVLDFVPGMNTVMLDIADGNDSFIPESGVVCVGVHSASLTDGIRIQTESPPTSSLQ